MKLNTYDERQGDIMFWGGLILGIMIGALVGMLTVAFMVASKDKDEEDVKVYEVAENNLRKYYTRPFNDIKLDGFKADLKIILKNDIEFYQKMYLINKSTYYLGRIEECKFIKDIITGGNKGE